MVERKTGRDGERGEYYEREGVVVFIFNRKGEALVLKESTENAITKKKVGDYSILCETSEDYEPWYDTVARGIEEELGIEEFAQEEVLSIYPNNSFLGETRFVKGVLARVVVLRLNDESVLGEFQTADKEVTIVGWKKPEELLPLPLREGVRNVLEKYIAEGVFDNPVFSTDENLIGFSKDSLKKEGNFS